MTNNQFTRRRFLATTIAASGLMGACVSPGPAPRRVSPNEKLNIGIIGGGGKGMENINGVSSEYIVAICDVDDNRAADAFKKLPQARRYKDFRKMLELEKTLDAVIVTTPDHTHTAAAVM